MISRAMKPTVDVVVLSRYDTELAPEVTRGLSLQSEVDIQLHRCFGEPRPDDACRWETIAHARNCGKRMGKAPWLMFLDDDVELELDAIAKLISGLQSQPLFGAMAADYLGEANDVYPEKHVAMGATLFRRTALDRIEFRWEPKKCECQCCCNDLRHQGIGIKYLSGVKAKHHLIQKPS